MYNINYIPQDLKNIKQWVAFDGKVPTDTNTGRPINALDNKYWMSFEQVIAATQNTEYNIGVVTGGTCRLAVVDIDKCIDSDGNLSDMAQDCIETLNSYTEYSQSGEGVHIYFFAALPDTYRNRTNGLEFYWQDRAIVVTGKAYPSAPSNVFPRNKEAEMMHYKYMPGHTDELGSSMKKLLQDETFIKLSSMPINPSDDNPDDETNNSVVDMRLCNCIARYTQDREVIKKILSDFTKRSRDKWYENASYVDRTIDAALKANNEFEQRSSINNLNNKEYQILDHYDIDSDCYYVEHSYLKDIEENKLSSYGNTGFINLDEVAGGLFAGVYIIAGASSVGKTTFCLQLANQLAEQQHHVLFFSLEQTKDELLSKSLTYLYYKNVADDTDRQISARELR